MLLLLTHDEQDIADPVSLLRYNEALQHAGVLLACDGLMPVATGTRVLFRAGIPAVTHGYPDSGMAISAYWLLEARTPQDAIEWAKRCPARDQALIEVRQIQDFPS